MKEIFVTSSEGNRGGAQTHKSGAQTHTHLCLYRAVLWRELLYKDAKIALDDAKLKSCL
jgi:hypothetical protein